MVPGEVNMVKYGVSDLMLVILAEILGMFGPELSVNYRSSQSTMHFGFSAGSEDEAVWFSQWGELMVIYAERICSYGL